MRYVFSKQIDFFAFVCPVLLAIAYLPTYSNPTYRSNKGALPLVHYATLVVFVDVAHVWGTLFRTYLDSEARNKRWRLFFYSPPIIWAVSAAAHAYSASFYWSLVAYFAIYHFVSQNYGLLALYKARCKERNRLDYRLDYYTLFAGALGPVLLWHASPTRRFDWFNAGEAFFFKIPDTYWNTLLGVYLSIGVLWLARQGFKIASGEESLNEGKMLIMGLSWLTWAVGALIDHQVLSLAFLNLFHGVPSMVIVWWVCRNRYADMDMTELSVTDRFTKMMVSGSWVWYFLFLCSLAFVEELLWEYLIWGNYHDDDVDWLAQYMPELSPGCRNATEAEKGADTALECHSIAESAVVALLALPQVTHYWLDAFIWKMDGSNAGLREALFPPPPDKED